MSRSSLDNSVTTDDATPPPAEPLIERTSVVKEPAAFRPRKLRRLRNRCIAGGLVGAIIAAAVFLSGLFNGFGLGAGAGGGPGSGRNQQPDSKSTRPEKTFPTITVPAPTEDEAVVVIRINERGFLKRRYTKTGHIYEPTTVEKIVDRVRRNDRKTEGIRVRVHLFSSGLVSRKNKLEQALVRAGVERSQIEWINEDF